MLPGVATRKREIRDANFLPLFSLLSLLFLFSFSQLFLPPPS